MKKVLRTINIAAKNRIIPRFPVCVIESPLTRGCRLSSYFFHYMLIISMVIMLNSQGHCQSQEVSNWSGYTGSFRKDHNFALHLGTSQTRWTVKPWDRSVQFNPVSRGYFSKFQYTFHIPLVASFGYFLGSSLGVETDLQRESEGFYSSVSYQLPGILFGLVMNFSPRFRLSTGVDVYLERIDNLVWQDEYTITQLSVNMLTLADMSVALDYFFRIDWAMRMEAHSRNVRYSSPQKNKEEKVVSSDLKRSDQWLGIGIVYHRL